MFEKLLKTAHESSSDVVICLKNSNDSYRGKILDIDSRCFTLFNSDSRGGVLWAFQLEDIVSCGLMIELPSSLKELSEILEVEKPSTRQPSDL